MEGNQQSDHINYARTYTNTDNGQNVCTPTHIITHEVYAAYKINTTHKESRMN